MRDTADRIRQAVLFEILGIVIVTPLGAWAFDFGMGRIGAVAIIGASVATLWNYAYNLGFDHLLFRLRGSADKTVPLRIVHAFGFEGGMLVLLVPVFAWWLGVTLVQAFLMDVSFAVFYLVYTFAFTWAYDTVFPVRRESQASKRAPEGAPRSRNGGAVRSRP